MPTTDPRELPDEPVAAANAMCTDTLVDKLGIVFTHVSAEQLRATMPVVGNIQPFGLLHGGAHGVLAESLGSVGANLSAGPGNMAVGTELSCSHHRPATRGLVTGTATRIALSRSFATYEIVITDDRDRRLCTSRLTCYFTPTGGKRHSMNGPANTGAGG